MKNFQDRNSKDMNFQIERVRPKRLTNEERKTKAHNHKTFQREEAQTIEDDIHFLNSTKERGQCSNTFTFLRENGF